MIKISKILIKVIGGICAVFVIASIVFSILVPANSGRLPKAPQTLALTKVRAIRIALESYASRHKGKYPEGKTSTEVFQKLLDDQDTSDPTIFYYPIPGKTEPTTSTLESENVCWDMTFGIDDTSPNNLPVVFTTGFKITYQVGSKVIFLDKPQSPISHTWANWWKEPTAEPPPFIAVSYKEGAQILLTVLPDSTLPEFIPTNFDPKGKVYRQLTP